MKRLLQILSLIAAVGLIVGITHLCVPDDQPRPKDRIFALVDRVDRTWGAIEDLRADMADLEDRVSEAREEAYQASKAILDQAKQDLETIPGGQGGPETPSLPLKHKTSSKKVRVGNE